ncbi:hypothetical protein CL616_04620 [archaeon]|nr:hypothetical protein [archaeon]
MKLKKELRDGHFRVAIFGSARMKKSDPDYYEVQKLAKSLAREEIDVITGGGPGLMDAASKGHHTGRKGKKVHSIGLSIKLPFEKVDSYHLDVKKEFPKFSKRLDTFMKLSNIVVVAPGGIGTILEFFYTWQLMQVKHICSTPIILLGDMWPGLIRWIKKEPLKRKLLNKEDIELVYRVKNYREAMKIVKEAHKEFQKGGKNFCLNYKKYK